MDKSFRLRSDIVVGVLVAFIGLTVFSSIDQFASRSLLTGAELPWYSTFKTIYNIYLGGMVVYFVGFAMYVIIDEKNAQIATLKIDIIRSVVHMKKTVELSDVQFEIDPESALECKVSEKMIELIKNTKAFKEIESKVMTSGFDDISKESVLFSEQLLNKYRPDSAISSAGKEKIEVNIKKIISKKTVGTNVSVGIPNAKLLVAEFLKDLDAKVKRIGEYKLYYVQLKNKLLLESNLEDLDDDEYEKRLEEKGVKTMMLLTPGDFYKVLKFKKAKIFEQETGLEVDARVANASMKLIRHILPKVPMLVVNDCALTNEAFWEITFNSDVLKDATTVAMSFLSYFAIDEAEDLRNELQKYKVNLLKAQTMIDAKKDDIIEEMILNGELKQVWQNSIKKTSTSEAGFKWSTLILSIVVIGLIAFSLFGGNIGLPAT